MSEVHLSFDQIRAAAHDNAQQRRDARMDYEEATKEAAGAEHDFRKYLAIRVAHYRAEEKGAGEAEILAQGDVAEHRRKRDLANARAKAALLRIEETEAERAMLRQLGDWSRELETTG